MDWERVRAEYQLLEHSTDAAVLLTELEWRRDRLTDEELAPEYQRMFDELRKLSERSLTEDLRSTDPRALFELVRYAKHLGMWKNYEQNQRRLAFLR